MKKILTFLALMLMGAFLSTAIVSVRKSAQADNIILKQNEELEDLHAILVDQQAHLRIMAYHQAVAQLEQNFPLEHRETIPAEEWEKMLTERAEQILVQSQREMYEQDRSSEHDH